MSAALADFQRAKGAALSDQETAETIKVENVTLKGELAKLNEELKAKTADALKWKADYEANNKRLEEKEATVYSKEQELAGLRQQVRDSVDAWNQLLAFISSYAGSYELKMTTRTLTDHIERLKQYTSKVPNMKQRLR